MGQVQGRPPTRRSLTKPFASSPRRERAPRRVGPSTCFCANAQRALPEALLLAVASALVDRGEEEEAALALLPARSPAALMLRADILLSRGGDLHGAAGLVEHVLFRDIDWPGARERHARWSREAAAIAGRGALEIDTPDSATRSGGGTPGLWGVDSRALRLVRQVARGGAGAVYEAEDSRSR